MWVDPASALLNVSTVFVEGQELHLTFSDEFEYQPNATGWEIHSQAPNLKWTATHALDSDTYDETFLHPSMVTVVNGSLNITGKLQRVGGGSYLGGQLSSWNRFCCERRWHVSNDRRRVCTSTAPTDRDAAPAPLTPYLPSLPRLSPTLATVRQTKVATSR